jgi:hypothetical protein
MKRFDPEYDESQHRDFLLGNDPITMEPWEDGEWVRYSDVQPLLAAAKQWRQATESRLRLLDSRGEAAKAMLKADADLIAVIERVGQ